MQKNIITAERTNGTVHTRVRRTFPFSSFRTFTLKNLAPWFIIVLSILLPLLYPDPLVNRFVKPKVIEAFGRAYPHHSLSLGRLIFRPFRNEFLFESVVVKTERGELFASVQSIALTGLGLRNLIFGRDLSLRDFENATVYSKDLLVNLGESSYELRCGEIRCSVSDSGLVIDGLEMYPSGGDASFFRGSRTRRTRYEFSAKQLSVTGAGVASMMNGEAYRAGTVLVHDMYLGVLVNKDKALSTGGAAPLMPGRMLAAVQAMVDVDSIGVTNGRLLYGEEIRSGQPPAVITFDHLNLSVKGLTNRRSNNTAVSLRAGGNFMGTSAMDIFMLIPVGSPEFSYRFAGSVRSLDIRSLNTFLETAELIRIKKGYLHMASFDVSVTSGNAKGNVRAYYTDLSFAALHEPNGEEKNIIESFGMFLANTFVIRGSNIPDKTGVLDLGNVKYTKKKNESFLEFSWFALRSGLKDIVGF